MMHPDDHALLLRICRAVAIVWILALSFRLGQGVYAALRGEF